MNSIELASIDGIINDDTSLFILVKKLIKDKGGDLVFLLPAGTSLEVKNKFDKFLVKVNARLPGGVTKIFPTIVKLPPEVIPEPVIEKVVIPEPVIEKVVILEPEVIPEPVVIAEKISAVETTKRKK